MARKTQLWIHQQGTTQRKGRRRKFLYSEDERKRERFDERAHHLHRVGERKMMCLKARSDNSKGGGDGGTTSFFKPNNPAALPPPAAPASAQPHGPHPMPQRKTRPAISRLLQPRGPSLLLRGRRAKELSEVGLERTAAPTRTGLEGVERRRRLRGLVRH